MKRYSEYKDSEIEWIGKIPKHWTIVRLRNLATVITGSTPSKADLDNYAVNGIPWVKPDDLGVDTPILKTKDYLSIAGGMFSRMIPPKAVLVCCIGSVGKTGIAGCVLATNQQINSVIFNPKLLNDRFGYYAIVVSEQEHIRFANRNVVSILNKDSQGNVSLPVAPLSEQRIIIEYLDRKTTQIDDLIVKKERMIQLLKEERAAIINQAVTKGLDPNVEMKDSGIDWLGKMPKHWEMKRLKYLVQGKLEYGANEVAESDDISMPRYIRITDFDDDGTLREDTFKSLTEDKAREYLLNEGDVLFARSGATVGKTFQFKNYKGMACFAGYLIKARPNQKMLSGFLYYFTRSNVYENWKDSIFNQATIQNIGADKYSILTLPVPFIDEQKKIVSYLDKKMAQIDAQVALEKKSIELLKEYRTALISEAVTGKIDVRSEN